MLFHFIEKENFILYTGVGNESTSLFSINRRITGLAQEHDHMWIIFDYALTSDGSADAASEVLFNAFLRKNGFAQRDERYLLRSNMHKYIKYSPEISSFIVI